MNIQPMETAVRYSVYHPTGQAKGLPKYATAFLRDEHGVFYASPFLAGITNEMTVILCLSYDDERWIMHEGHVYAKTEWLLKEYGRRAEGLDETIQHITGKIESAFPFGA